MNTKQIKKPVLMLWQSGKVTQHNMTEKQQKAFRQLYQTYNYIILKKEF